MRKLAVILVFLTIPVLLWAQSPDRVREELERTDAIIQQARSIIEPSSNPEAQLLLDQATEIQQTAWEGYRRKRYRWSYSRTLAARQRAREAMELITLDPKRIEAEIDRTNELMNQLRADIARTDDPQIVNLWNTAQTEQHAALNYLQTRRWRWALRFTIAARNHIYEIMGKMRRFQSRDKIQRELEHTEMILQRLGETVSASHNFRAQEMFARAGAWQVQAQNRFRSRLYGPTLKLTLAARELALRAWQLVIREPDSTFVRSMLSETDHLIDQWAEKINQHQNPELQEMLALASKYQSSARERYLQGDFTRALRQTNEARQILYRVIELLNFAAPPSEGN